MGSTYSLLKFLHVLGFVFMAIPLFNLIVVNERALLGGSFQYHADRYMENIVRRGAVRCFVFQGTVFASGVLMLLLGPLGLGALWGNWVLLVKTLLLFTLMGSSLLRASRFAAADRSDSGGRERRWTSVG